MLEFWWNRMALPKGWYRKHRVHHLVILLSAWAVRAFHLDAQPLWLDEAFSVWMAAHPAQEILFWTRTLDQHPPLYYLLLYLWTRVWGDGEWSVRFLSLAGGWLAVALSMAIARHLGGRRLMGFSGILVAFSPFFVRYAQEARMYAWVLSAVALGLWGAVRLWYRPDDRFGGIALVLGSALAAWLHNVALLFPLGIFPLLIWRAHRVRTQSPAWILKMFGLFLLLWGGWIPALVGQIWRMARRFWVPPLSVYRMITLLASFSCPFSPTGLIVRLCAPLWMLGTLWGGWQLIRQPRPRDRGALLLLVTAWVPLVIVLLISLVRPILVPRVLIWLLLPALIMLAYGIASLSQRWRYVLLSAIVVINGLSLQGYFVRFHKEPWDQVAAYVAHHVQPGDLLLFEAGWVRLPFDYYFRADVSPLEEHGLPADPFVTGTLEPPFHASDIPRLLHLITGRERVWVVLSHVPYTDPHRLAERTLRAHLQCREERFQDIRVLECWP